MQRHKRGRKLSALPATRDGRRWSEEGKAISNLKSDPRGAREREYRGRLLPVTGPQRRGKPSEKMEAGGRAESISKPALLRRSRPPATVASKIIYYNLQNGLFC